MPAAIRRLGAFLTATAALGCAPRVPPLLGVVADEGVPSTALPPGHLRLVFRWAYDDALFAAKGEGVARVAAPDSVRLDFFVDAGLGAGEAILIGDRLETANEDAPESRVGHQPGDRGDELSCVVIAR